MLCLPASRPKRPNRPREAEDLLRRRAGVGKTYSMLEAARKVAKEGMDVVVGYLEPHCRPDTQALVLGLDVLPRLEVPYRGTKLLEFNLDAALALHPQLLIVDELGTRTPPA